MYFRDFGAVMKALVLQVQQWMLHPWVRIHEKLNQEINSSVVVVFFSNIFTDLRKVKMSSVKSLLYGKDAGNTLVFQ